MSDGMNTVILMNTVLGYECSVDEAITIETMMFKNMRSEITRLTTELELAHKYRTEISTELTAYMVACENIKGQLSGERVRAEQAEKELAETRAELSRYKQGVEVNGYVTGVPDDIDANLYFASGWSRELGKLKGKVRVLVMPMEDKNE